ncbi:MAG TPA: phosphoenolpyruvate--protein phosphotransferase [Candidatus Polarisedimenticolia bacterium]|jgi:phosphoenolpyruvate-protein phosphotransferase|nr:phosphoenolpyruvate--protein phosphotransferase [Candidatus Polarisedimenticolia bacterium]
MSPELSSTSLQLAFVCPLSAGMHARPASQLAGVANNFVSEWALTNLRNRREANAKSVLSIISADIRHGDRCLVQVSGADEQPAHTALRRFVEEVLPSCDVPLAVSSPQTRNSMPRVLQAAGMNCYFGSSASPGIAHGKVVVVSAISLPKGLTAEIATDPEQELKRIKLAIAAVRERIGQKLTRSSSPLAEAVLRADLAMANDVLLAEKFAEQVSKGKSAGYAVVETGKFFINLLRQSESEYVRERAADVEEISVQLLDEMYGADLETTVLPLQEPSIVVAETLGPQQLLALDRHWLRAIVLEYSGSSSHALILARSHAIPAVVGVKNARLMFSPGQEVVVDGTRGVVVPQFSAAVQRFYEREQRTLQRQKERLADDPSSPAITRDGNTLEVAANASSAEELALAFENGAEGIGLFRTEMSFLERDRPPSEEEQFATYSQAVRLCAGRPIIIRTLDLGGDKAAPYLNLPSEENPFLGYRGARIYADHRELLQTQLQAIIRASAHGRIQIMAPMISSLEEVLQFKDEVAKAKRHLQIQNTPFQSDIPIGIMVEVPSAAFILDQLCSEVDFFSIGTNDLAQYFLAVDRGNARVAGLSNVLHPGFLRLLKRIVDEIHAAGKWVGMCGEMASEMRYLPLILGLGLDEISLPAVKIPELKHAVSQLSTADCKSLLTQIIACREKPEIDRLLASAQASPSAQPLLSEELIVMDSDSRNKEEAMQELVDSFYIAGRTQDRHQLEEALWAREAVYSTGLGFGFATPHCKTTAVTANSIGVLRSRLPIDWGSVDSSPVRMIVLIVMREPQTDNGHMQVFSKLARKLMNEEFREHLLAIEDSRNMMRYLGEELDISVSCVGF